MSSPMTEHPRFAQKRLAEAGDKLGQWLEEAAAEWEAHGVVAAEVWERIEEKALGGCGTRKGSCWEHEGRAELTPYYLS